MFEIVDDVRRTPEHGYTISSPMCLWLRRAKKNISHWSKRYIFEKCISDVHRFSNDEHQFSSHEKAPGFSASL